MAEVADLDVVPSDGRALVAAAESNWARPVPDCPDWDAAGLVRHTGAILLWMAGIVSTGERVSFRALPPIPDDDAELSKWFLVNLGLFIASEIDRDGGDLVSAFDLLAAAIHGAARHLEAFRVRSPSTPARRPGSRRRQARRYRDGAPDRSVFHGVSTHVPT